MKKSLLFIVLLLLIFACSESTGNNDPVEKETPVIVVDIVKEKSAVEAVSRARIKALNDSDQSAFDTIYDKDYSRVSTWGSVENIETIRKFIDYLNGMIPSDYKVTILNNGTAAFAVYKLYESDTRTTMFTEFYIKKDSEWVIVHGHNSLPE